MFDRDLKVYTLFCMNNASILTFLLQLSLVVEICPLVISSAVVKGSCSMGLVLLLMDVWPFLLEFLATKPCGGQCLLTSFALMLQSLGGISAEAWVLCANYASRTFPVLSVTCIKMEFDNPKLGNRELQVVLCTCLGKFYSVSMDKVRDASLQCCCYH